MHGLLLYRKYKYKIGMTKSLTRAKSRAKGEEIRKRSAKIDGVGLVYVWKTKSIKIKAKTKIG